MCEFYVSPEAKKKVLKKRDHKIVFDGKPVAIFLETTKKPVEDLRPRPQFVTQSPDEALSDEGPVYNSDDTIVQEVSVDRRAGTDATTAPRSPLLPFWSSSLSWALAVRQMLL